MLLHWMLFVALSVQFLGLCTAGNKTPDAQVIIVGGGVSGLYAASDLKNQHGIDDILILEETDIVGGASEPIEFGGLQFVKASVFAVEPTTSALERFGVDLQKINPNSYTVYNQYGEDVTAEAMEREAVFLNARDEDLDQLIDDIDNLRRPDISYKATLASNGWVAKSDIDKVMEWYNFDFYEGLSSRDVSTIRTYRQFMDERFSDRYLMLGDANILIDNLAGRTGPDRIVLNSRAALVNQTSDYVVVTTENGTEYIGDYAIVTSTVGVIQNGGLTFEPPLPPWKSEEFFRYQMGTFDLIFLQFPTKFWDDTEYILHASDRHGFYPAFLNLEAEGFHPVGTNILIGFLTGDEAYRAELLSDDEVKSEVLGVLKYMYGESNVPDPTEFNMTRLATNKDLYGSFAASPIGILPQDSQMRLKAHVGRLYFAPEDAADENIGILYGSVGGGEFAAAEVAGCIQKGNCDEYTLDDKRPLCRPPSKKLRKNQN